ncbi:expressed unknown protein [Seminavis robusta]|uniref:Uncharacterized protein n=1 Tax=Seminavis robusta TaxID=568900 RepID=A0A9N8EN84_9STRA|nr:expressed unknown protein [Seminavis robusta]|eukprot:Sro1606_g285500.1 n/a (1170) ;mRNA; f:9786-13295
MGRGQQRQRQPAAPPPRPPKPMGHIVDLTPEPSPDHRQSTPRTRSIAPPPKAVPGLSVHIPEPFTRDESQESQQEEALRQLQRLRLELLGERKQQEQAVREAARKAEENRHRHKRQQKQLQKLQQQMQTQHSEPSTQLPPKRAQQQSFSGSVPVVPIQSPYYSTYSPADILKSPLSCLSSEHMLSQVQDEPVNRHEETPPSNKDDDGEPNVELQLEAALATLIEPNPEMSQRQSSLTRRASFQALAKAALRGSPKSSNQETSSITPPIIPPKQNGEMTTSLIPGYDEQKSLEKQFAGLPGARPPGSSRSFDNHSFIVSSGNKSIGSSRPKFKSVNEKQQPRRLDEMVSVVPCDSYTPPVEQPNSLLTIKKLPKRLPKRLPKQHRADTVRFDKGLSCVDPNNLKPQMQEILQKKPNVHRMPDKQVGMIVEAVDLVDESKRKGRLRMRKLKELVPDRVMETWSRAVSPKKRPGSTASGHTESETSKYWKSSKTGEAQSVDDRLWVKQTIEQQNYKITKVLGSEMLKVQQRMQDERGIAGDVFLPISPGGPGRVEERNTADASRTGASSRNGKSLTSKVPSETSGKQKDNDIGQDYNIDNPQKNEDSSKKASMPLKGIIKAGASMARRLTQKELLASMAKELADKKTEAIKKRNDSAKEAKGEMPPPQKSLDSALGKLENSRRGRPPMARYLRVDSRPTSPRQEEGAGGSFCVAGSPSLESFSSYAFNQSIANAMKMLTDQEGDGSAPNVLPIDDEDEHPLDMKELAPPTPAVPRTPFSEQELAQKKTQAVHDAKKMMLFSLKKRIVAELKRQKMREAEALVRGETIPEEEKEKKLEAVRRLHLRREALQQLSDEDIMEAFTKTLALNRTKQSFGESTVKHKGEKSTKSDESESHEKSTKASNKKTVSFARQPTPPPRKVMISLDETDRHSLSPSDDCEDDIADVMSDETNHTAKYGILSWAQCVNEVGNEVCANGRVVVTEAEAAQIRNAAFEAVDLAARDSYRKAKQRLCTPPSHHSLDGDESSSGRSSETSYTSFSKSRRNKNRKDTGEKSSSGQSKDKLRDVLSYSGSLVSESSRRSRGSRETQDTRETEETRETEYTSDTRETEDSRFTHSTRGSFFTFDTRDSHSLFDRNGPKKGYPAYSVAGTEFLSEYTDETFEDGLLQCGGGF